MNRTNENIVNRTEITRKSMTHAEFFKLCEWLRRNEKMLKDERPDLRMTAEKFHAETGITCSHTSVGDARKTVGIEWVAVNNMRNGQGTGISKFNKLYADFKILARCVVELHAKCGEIVPDELRLMAMNRDE